MEAIKERAFEFCPSAGTLSSDPKVFPSFNLQDEKQSLAYALEKDEISGTRFSVSILKKHPCVSAFRSVMFQMFRVLKHLVAIKYQNY